MTNFERITASVDDLAWELMEFRVDAHAASDGYEGGLPNTKKKIVEWLESESAMIEVQSYASY